MSMIKLANVKLNLYLEGQGASIEACIKDNFTEKNISVEKIGEIKKNLQKASLSCPYVLILKITNYVIKIFRQYDSIDKLLKADHQAKILLQHVFNFISTDKINSYVEIKKYVDDVGVKRAAEKLRDLQIEQCVDALDKEDLSKRPYLQKAIQTLIKYKDSEAKLNDPVKVSEAKKTLKQLLKEQRGHLENRDDVKLRADDHIIQLLSDTISELNPYNVSFESVEKELGEEAKKPLKITMIGVEYTGLVKQGGLAEALEGLSQGLKKEGNTVTLIFPKFSTIPETKMKYFKTFADENGDRFDVYQGEENGVNCYFIDHRTFTLRGDSPSIYGPTADQQAERFAHFSRLAASFLQKMEKPDVVHIHDWHAAGVALCLRNQKEKWSNGEIPPVVFTFHNNNRVSQGALEGGMYSTDGMAQAYIRHKITTKNDNLFIKTVEIADAVTTVSNGFVTEAQYQTTGEGVSWAIRLAAKIGKLFGVINGSNPERWNPEDDPTLKELNLNYGPNKGLENKEKCKAALGEWIATHKSEVKFDVTKPIVTYVGRFDSYQKGLDKFEEAIDATIANGGQFICMGSQEDENATKILNKLEAKYKEGVLFLRDEKNRAGKFIWQQEKKGGSLVRAASDFVFIPSRFEPCGLVQFEGWLFGSLAIGARTGGLADTIKTDGDHFNGYLFDREDSKHTASSVIQTALTEWQELCKQPKEKSELLKRVMLDARKCSWTDSPEGLSPVQKYKLVYAKAIQRAQVRKKTAEFDPIDALRRRFTEAPSEGMTTEEAYLKELYSGHDRDKLLKLYHKLHWTQRARLPHPYGQHVNCTKHEQFGSFHFNDGTYFTVEAPHADRVQVLLYDEEGKIVGGSDLQKYANGVWECQIPNLKPGQRYRYKINDKVLKIDPYGRQAVRPFPKDPPYSVVVDNSTPYDWKDTSWMGQRVQESPVNKPMSILEVHPTSWKSAIKNYDDLATYLIKHCKGDPNNPECKANNYTHVELMGILDHPDERSWGYQVTGYFTPNSRLGTPDQFKKMIDRLHQAEIGVILDWVPAHFATDDFGLEKFDGTCQYESHKPDVRTVAFGYGSKHYNFSKKEVREFLISNAVYWLKEMHIDGIRVDCVRSILNAPDQASAKLFFQDFNALAKAEGAFTIAEDYSGDKDVTKPFHEGGLGFDMKWATGLKSHIIKYFKDRNYDTLKNGILYTDPDCTKIVYYSHDEDKEANDHYVWTNLDKGQFVELGGALAAKKHHFMTVGYSSAEKQWSNFVGKGTGATDRPVIEGAQEKIAYLNYLYLHNRAFSQLDRCNNDLEWIEDSAKKIHAYRRKVPKGSKSTFTTLHNFGSNEDKEFFIPLKEKRDLCEIFNSSLPNFTNNTMIKKEATGYKVTVPAGGTVIISEVQDD